MSSSKRERRCPQCDRPITPRWAPFCSERCRAVDLGKWLGEEYRVAVKHADHDEDGNTAALPDAGPDTDA